MAPELRRERAREKEVIKRRLRSVIDASAPLAQALSEVLAGFNGKPGDPASFDELDRLLGGQGYRLASWRVASEEINYRRFFDINELAAIRMELPGVFERAHALLLELLNSGKVNALRLDHTDGLYDPLGYFESLQSHFRRGSRRDIGPDDLARPLPVLIEKILERGETIPAAWPIDGTTGYEFGAAAMGLFVDSRAERAFTTLYETFARDDTTFAEHVYRSRHHILRYSLASEVSMLGRSLERIANANRRSRDFTLAVLARAMVEVLAAFPVYRTYLREGSQCSEHDERCVHEAIRSARKNNPSIDASVFEFLQQVLLLRCAASDSERQHHERFALRFQQLTGPVKAKAEEDTAFYRYTRLVCLNEVGNNPGKFGVSVEDFHAQNVERARAWPLGMVTTSTHDSKRGEDTSARIAVLSEMPEVWRRALRAFDELAGTARETVDGESAPARSLEYLFYQSLLGIWPPGWDGRSGRAELTERLCMFLAKASKEAKQQTSWTNPNPAYDAAVDAFVRKMLENDRFMDEMRKLCELVAPHGAANGLGLTLLRSCSPGIPDLYQGAELWNQTLVDPDNRRPVDYDWRREALAALIAERVREPAALARKLLESYADGRIKLLVTHAALLARRRSPELFLQGSYEALPAGDHVVAFTRATARERLVCAVTRLSCKKTEGGEGFVVGEAWGDERLRVPHPGRYRDALTNRELELGLETKLSDVFRDLPVALLVQEERRKRK
jgi:(1->4)-alpha-D-glucan 1-alpha-D-glucosylmutase